MLSTRRENGRDVKSDVCLSKRLFIPSRTSHSLKSLGNVLPTFLTKLGLTMARSQNDRSEPLDKSMNEGPGKQTYAMLNQKIAK